MRRWERRFDVTNMEDRVNLTIYDKNYETACIIEVTDDGVIVVGRHQGGWELRDINFTQSSTSTARIKMKPCEWCGKDVGEVNYGHLSYWDKNKNIRTGYWHKDCWGEYWVERKRSWYKKLWDKIRGSAPSTKEMEE